MGRPEALEAFLAASGGGRGRRAGAGGAIRSSSASCSTILLQSDALVLDFAAGRGRAPEAPARARAALPGGYAPDWT